MEEEKREQVCEQLGWRGVNNKLEMKVREPQESWEKVTVSHSFIKHTSFYYFGQMLIKSRF